MKSWREFRRITAFLRAQMSKLRTSSLSNSMYNCPWLKDDRVPIGEMIKFGLSSVNANADQKIRIRTFSANEDHSESTACGHQLGVGYIRLRAQLSIGHPAGVRQTIGDYLYPFPKTLPIGQVSGFY